MVKRDKKIIDRRRLIEHLGKNLAFDREEMDEVIKLAIKGYCSDRLVDALVDIRDNGHCIYDVVAETALAVWEAESKV